MSRAPESVPASVRSALPATHHIARQRLHHLISDDACPITLVCAPAGSGKTSLLLDWAASPAIVGRVAWFSVDRHDRTANHVWRGILRALRESSLVPGGVAPFGDLGVGDEGFVTELIANLTRLDALSWLVIDDVHLIPSLDALEPVADLIRLAPSQLHLVLTSRSDPPLNLPRLRIEGRVRDIRAEDLAFSVEEVGELLGRQGIGLSGPALETLHERTEGWPAGVRIAALAMGSRTDPDELVDRFSGDDHAVADYLVTEVLSSLDQRHRDLLLRTSICHDFAVDLARALTSETEAAMLLDQLVQDNAFTVRVGRGRERYRYHELLRTYLTAELRRREPDLLPQLHVIAAEWFEAHGEPLRALEHLALAPGETERLVTAVNDHGLALVFEGEAAGVAATLGAVDADARSRPEVRLVAAAACLELGDLPAADRWLATIDAHRLAAADGDLAALAVTLVLARARYSGPVEPALAAADAIPETSGHLDRDVLALHHRGVARLEAGRYEDAATDLERAIELASIARHPAAELASLSFLSAVHACRGRFEDARPCAERAIALADPRGWSSRRALANAYRVLAWSDHLRVDEAGAAANATLALESLGADRADPNLELSIRGIGLLATSEPGDRYDALRRFRERYQQLATGHLAPGTVAIMLPELMRICHEVGEPQWARGFAESGARVIPSEGEGAFLEAFLLYGLGKLDAARRVLRPLVSGQLAWLVPVTAVRISVLAAVLEHQRGNTTVAQTRLVEALGRAESATLRRPFVGDDAVRALLIAGTGRFGRLEAFAQSVLAVAASAPGHARLLDPLTPAELEVLRDLPSLLSLREIAAARSVSVNTVKTHLRAIYRKLGVAGRRAAVDVARAEGLL